MSNWASRAVKFEAMRDLKEELSIAQALKVRSMDFGRNEKEKSVGLQMTGA